VDKRLISQVSIAGFVLSLIGLGMFALLWIVLGNANVDTFMRLFISICVPPMVMAAVVGAYILIARPGAANTSTGPTEE
jgi:hypothetical protein